jgi:MOSC domain-containing protein YiiM
MARLLSVNVGLPRDIEWQGKTVHTAVWKTPVQGRRMTRRLNVDGDGQGDLAGHGGEHRAVFVYQIESYRYWQNQLGRNDFTYGQFGENFTVEGLADTEVCVGDHYRIGDALFEVTQPRVTCYRVGIRMNEPQMAALLQSTRWEFTAPDGRKADASAVDGTMIGGRLDWIKFCAAAERLLSKLLAEPIPYPPPQP